MHVNPEDRPAPRQQPQSKRWISLILACLVIAGLVYFVLGKSEQVLTPEVVQLPDIQPEEVITTTPEEMTPAAVEKIPAVMPVEESAIELPTLDHSDPLMREKIAALSSSTDLSLWLKSKHLIRRGVAIIDSLGDGAILNKLLNIPAPKGQFRATKEGKLIWLNPDNYQRYSYLVDAISSIDSKRLTKIYHQFRPLLEQAYAELGHAESTLDSAIIGAFEQLLSAPVLNGAVELKLESVAYTFADPKLEKLPSIQKLLIRMGPENTESIQRKVQELRTELLGGSDVLAQ